MDIEELVEAIQASNLSADEKIAALAAIARGGNAGYGPNKKKYEMELEAFLLQAKMQTQNTLDSNVNAIRGLAAGVLDGQPATAAVVATYAMTNNWIELMGGLISPWKRFTQDI